MVFLTADLQIKKACNDNYVYDIKICDRRGRIMKIAVLSIITAFIFANAAYGQNVIPQPTPPKDEGDVVKISTNLIQVDITVTDSRGRIISDLKPDEVEIYENGRKQTIMGFNFVSAGQPIAATPRTDRNPSVPLPPSPIRPEQIRRTIALVVDDLSLSHESTQHTKRTLRKFVDEQMQPGDLVAIIRSRAGIGSLQQFTSDKRILHAAIDQVKWYPMGTGGISSFAPIEPNSLAVLAAAGDKSVTQEQMDEEANRMNAFSDFRGSIFAAGTLGALRFAIGGMAQLPGRKSVLMFSDGFRLFERDRDGAVRTGKVMDYMRLLIDQANRASVVFYTIDPRGVPFIGLTAADSTRGMSAADMRGAEKARRDQLFETRAGLNYLAEETGGFAVFNTNDLTGGVGRAMADQSYYLLAYEPDSDTFDPAKRKFNRLEVKVLRKGLQVRYRSGFFNNAGPPQAGPDLNAATTPNGRLQAALFSPFTMTDIGLRLNALFGSTGPKASFVRSLLHIDAAGLTFTDEPDGTKKAMFEVLATSFGDSGQLVDQIGRSYELSVPPDVYAKIMSDGFVYHFQFPVKTPGAFQYRVAIRDAGSDRLGTASQFIEVPDLKRNRLTLSGIVLESLTAADYDRSIGAQLKQSATDAMNDTALRRIKLGTVLRYSAEVYNAKIDRQKQTSLRFRIRVFREGELVLDGDLKPLEPAAQKAGQPPHIVGAMAIGNQMDPGDYILQIIVMDDAAKADQKVASHFVQFEVVP
jgi:VWFA-related protein